MALPVGGEWARQALSYSGAAVWGTGVNQVHYYYGSNDDRLRPVNSLEGQTVPPFEGVPDTIEQSEMWGYTPEDSLYTGMSYDDRPPWSEDSPQFRMQTDNMPAWSAPGPVVNTFRAMFGGAHRTFRGISQAFSPVQYMVPTETVSEGWLNKPKGAPADAVPSDPSQYEMQTSMTQRYKTRTNVAAVKRATDEARAGIGSKVTGIKLKVYSGGERHYDMLPKAQDDIPRPFYYRTAGTGRRSDMWPNTMWSIYPIERQPPPQPSIGAPETEINSDYGYTAEDGQYYG